MAGIFIRPPQFNSADIRSNQQRDGADLGGEFARYAVFEELLTPERGMVQLALRWLLDEPTTSVVIPGGKSLADYRQAIRATELPPLTIEEKGRIEELKEALN